MSKDYTPQTVPLAAVLETRARLLIEERRLCESIPRMREAAAIEAVNGVASADLARVIRAGERLGEVRELIAGIAAVARATEIREREAIIAEIQGASAAVQAEIDLVDKSLAALVEESLKSKSAESRELYRDLHRTQIRTAFISGKLPEQDLKALAKYKADHATQAHYRSRLDIENLRLANLRTPNAVVTAEKLLERTERAAYAVPAGSAA